MSQRLIETCLGALPEELQGTSHFHYASRIPDIGDGLPEKHWPGTCGAGPGQCRAGKAGRRYMAFS